MNFILAVFALGIFLTSDGHTTTGDGHVDVDRLNAQGASNPLKRTYSCMNVFEGQSQRFNQPPSHHNSEKSEESKKIEHSFMIFFQQSNSKNSDDLVSQERNSKRQKKSSKNRNPRKIKLRTSPGFGARFASSEHNSSNQLAFFFREKSIEDEVSDLEKIRHNFAQHSEYLVSALGEEMKNLDMTPTPQNSPALSRGEFTAMETLPRSISATLSVPSVRLKIWEKDQL